MVGLRTKPIHRIPTRTLIQNMSVIDFRELIIDMATRELN